jgi:hypothetical protein
LNPISFIPSLPLSFFCLYSGDRWCLPYYCAKSTKIQNNKQQQKKEEEEKKEPSSIKRESGQYRSFSVKKEEEDILE